MRRLVWIPVSIVASLAGAFWHLQQEPIQSKPGSSSATSNPIVDRLVNPGEKPNPIVAETGPYPQAMIEAREFDFGTMEQNVEGSHTFRIRNMGSAPLQIVVRDSETSCDCTVAKVSRDDLILSGEEVAVELTWNIKPPIEDFRQSAKVRTNDPQNPMIELTIKGRIDQRFHFSPKFRWYLEHDPLEQIASHSGLLFSRTLARFDPPEFICANRRIAADWEPLDADELFPWEAKSGYRLTIHADLKGMAEAFDDQVTLKSPLNDSPITQFYVRSGVPNLRQ